MVNQIFNASKRVYYVLRWVFTGHLPYGVKLRFDTQGNCYIIFPKDLIINYQTGYFNCTVEEINRIRMEGAGQHTLERIVDKPQISIRENSQCVQRHE